MASVRGALRKHCARSGIGPCHPSVAHGDCRADHRPGGDPGGARRRDAGGAIAVTRRIALRLARLGFLDADGAGALLSRAPPSLWDAEAHARVAEGAAAVAAALGRSADPDAAVRALARVAEPELLDAVRTDTGLRTRLTSLLGASPALADHLAAHPGDWRVLAGDRKPPVL